MEIKIIKDQKNELFSRREVEISIDLEITPSKIEARDIVAKKFSSDPSLIRIRKINSKFGSKTFIIDAAIYDSKEEFERIVKKTKQEVEAEKKAEEERIKAEEEAKAAEAAGSESEEVLEENN